MTPAAAPSAGQPTAGRCIVVGAGLAGAAAAASLARRGWRVEVLDAAPQPAAGASALPVGLMAPHQSRDDNPLSRLTRSGIRIALQECQARLVRGQDWEPCGVLEQRGRRSHALPPLPELEPWTRQASAAEKAAVGFGPEAPAWWHANAAWVRPAALVRAWLAQPGVAFRGGLRVAGLRSTGGDWQLLDAEGRTIAQAPLLIVAAAHGSAPLLEGAITTGAVRGQVSWALHDGSEAALPAFAVNGHGHFLPRVPLPEGQAWLTGSSYGREDADGSPRPQDDQANLERLRQLLPAAAQALAPRFEAGTVRSWAGVRCVSADRRPLVGEVRPGLWVSTAMGSRGLSFAALAAELIAARLHGEPAPLEPRLAQWLDFAR